MERDALKDHPLLGLWIVMVADPAAPSGRAPLVGRSDGELFVLAFRDVRRARLCAEQAGGGDVVLVVTATVSDLTSTLVAQGVTGVVIDWVPGQPTVEEARPLVDPM
jgi:hypothetical protein